MDICHFKNTELEPQLQKYKGRVVLQGDIVKDDLGAYAVFTEQGLSASQMTAVKIMNVIARLPGCDGQAADAVSAKTQVKLEDAPRLLKIPRSECPDIWIRLPRHKWPKSRSSMEDSVVPLQRNLYGHHLAGLLWERQFEKVLLEHGWEIFQIGNAFSFTQKKRPLLSVYVDDMKLAGKKTNIDPMWKVFMKEVDLGEPTSFLDHVYLGCTQGECQTSKDVVDNFRKMFESQISGVATEKIPFSEKLVTKFSSWSYDMEGHAKKCVERYCELANKAIQQLYKVATPCIDDHQFKEEEMGSVGELSKVCSQIVLRCLYLARIGRPDILWSVNKLARAVTKWTRACDKHSARLISYIHHTSEYRQHCYVGNTAQHCRLGLFQDSDFAGDLQDSTPCGLSCIFGSHTFVSKSWMCKKQTSVSHSSTDAENIFLDAGLRMDGIPALNLWDLVTEVFHSSPNHFNNTKDQVRGNSSRNTTSDNHTHNETKVPTQHDNFDLSNVDYVSSNAKYSRFVHF